jgi:hypothetical protein
LTALAKLIDQHQVGVVAIDLTDEQLPPIARYRHVAGELGRLVGQIAHALGSAVRKQIEHERLGGRPGEQMLNSLLGHGPVERPNLRKGRDLFAGTQVLTANPAASSPTRLGLMAIEPNCTGRCTIKIVYDGGTEMRIARWLSWMSLTGCLFCSAWHVHPFA